MFGFSKEEMQDRYVLGGNEHLPGKASDFSRASAKTFTIIYGEHIKNDEDAISAANQSVQRALASAEPGRLVGATLHFNGRMVKNFPDTPATSNQSPE